MTLRSHSPKRIGRGVSLPGFDRNMAELPNIQRHACGNVPTMPRSMAVSSSRNSRVRSARFFVESKSFMCSSRHPDGPGPAIGGKEMPLSGWFSKGSLDVDGIGYALLAIDCPSASGRLMGGTCVRRPEPACGKRVADHLCCSSGVSVFTSLVNAWQALERAPSFASRCALACPADMFLRSVLPLEVSLLRSVS